MLKQELISLIIQAFIAIGTVGAVITSLCFARGARRINAKASIGFKCLLGGGSEEDFVGIKVINKGTKPFKIYSVIGRDKNLKELDFLFPPNYAHPHCTKVGHFYTESEDGLYIFPHSVFVDSLIEKLEITDPNDEIITRLKEIKLSITTSADQEIKIDASQTFYEDWENHIKNFLKEQQK